MDSVMPARMLLLVVFLCAAGCASELEPVAKAPRAVSFATLELTEPQASDRLTGTVESWKREDIGFEVAGRLLRIVEPGVDIIGRAYDETGNQLYEGTVLAELDAERYQIAKRQAQTTADAARTELEQVIPQQIAEAEAGLTLADRELQRYANLVATQSASQQELDIRDSAQKAAKAKVAQVEALRATKAALLNTALASVEQADVNIDDCRLTSPFTGQIARVHIIPGGYALPGQPVVTVQMMDPMKVQIAVSPDVDKRIDFNDRLRVFLPDSDRWVEGLVYLKDTYADPATRTYLITLLVRNEKAKTVVPDELKGSSYATTQKLWTLHTERVGDQGNYFIDVESLHEDDQGYYVWKVDGLTVDDLYGKYDPVLNVSKVRVTPGEGRIPSLQVFTFRELVDHGELDPDTDVILGAIEGEVIDGIAVLSQERWLLRPGDLVEVALPGTERQAGYYVPRVAILGDGDQPHVFVVSDGTSTATRVDVAPLETSGQHQRIVATSEGGLTPGDRIIVGGAPYVMEGEAVSLVEELELTP